MALIPCPECGRLISDKAYSCPQCGHPTGVLPPSQTVGLGLGGYEYRSGAELFGLPLVHIAGGWSPDGRRRVAKGIIAIGDIAFGFVALRGLALGGVTLGGLSIGIFALGGLAVGIWLALGGLAIGGVAVGGLAIGYYALGGAAFGAHPMGENAFDPEAYEFFQSWLGGIRGQMKGGGSL